MISNLHISRFKSIKELTLPCRRINIFIGEPNTGKSNILEALGMFSFLYYSRFGYPARQFVRFVRTSNIFYDESLSHPVEVQCDDATLAMEFKDGGFEGTHALAGTRFQSITGDHNNVRVISFSGTDPIGRFKFYRFSVKESFERRESDFLLPPSGDNLLSLLLTNRELMSIVNQPFAARGLRLRLRPQEGKIEVEKQEADVVVIAYPYQLASETLQRVTFYLAAILSNKKSVLVFEEPESHSFPYYTKYLAELIALDQNENQYFISTHNPYFLMPVLEKAPKDDVSVHIVYYENYETKAKALTGKDVEEIMELDVFSNLERYLEPG